jgi:hypothetical protein
MSDAYILTLEYSISFILARRAGLDEGGNDE